MRAHLHLLSCAALLAGTASSLPAHLQQLLDSEGDNAAFDASLLDVVTYTHAHDGNTPPRPDDNTWGPNIGVLTAPYCMGPTKETQGTQACALASDVRSVGRTRTFDLRGDRIVAGELADASPNECALWWACVSSAAISRKGCVRPSMHGSVCCTRGTGIAHLPCSP